MTNPVDPGAHIRPLAPPYNHAYAVKGAAPPSLATLRDLPTAAQAV